MRASATNPKRLIVTADDFGTAVPINEAVEFAHRDGILTSASLMVTARDAADAIERAHRLPRLGIGLHLTLIDGYPALPPAEIPDLVASDGRFFRHELPIVWRLTFSPRARRQAAAEVRAQLERFRATGLRLDHVDGHHNLHLHPAIQRILVTLAGEFGIRSVRVPHEPFAAGWQAMRDRWLLRRLSSVFVASLARGMRRRLAAAGIACNDHVFGVIDSGHMHAERLRRYLGALPTGVSELYLHPATRRWGPLDALPESYEPEAEYGALIDPGVRHALTESGAELTTFGALTPAPSGALA